MAHPPTPATASSSSSASPPLAGVIEALSKISADGLTILILQQPTIGRAICQALRSLAKQALADVVEDDVKVSRLPVATFVQVLDILEEASLSSDPTLIRRLASAPDVVFNLCILATSLSSPSCSARAQRILPRLVDAAAVKDMLSAALLALKEQTEEGTGEKKGTFRAARIVAALLAYLPRPQQQQQRRGGGAAGAQVVTGGSAMDSLASILSTAYEQASKAGQSMLATASKVALLDCASALLSRVLNDDGDDGKEGRVARIVVKLSRSSSASTLQGQSLVDFSLLADLAVAQPDLCDRVGRVLGSSAAAEAQQARKALQEAQQEAGAVASPSTSLESKGAAWQAILQHAREQRAGPSSVQPPSSAYLDDTATSTSTSKGKGRAASTPSDSYEAPASLLATIEAILPHLAEDPVRLRKTLGRPEFRGKEEGEVVEMLLDGVWVESEDDEGIEEVVDTAPTLQTQHTSAPAPASTANRRPNIFDAQPLQAAHLRYAGTDDDTGSPHNKAKLDPSLRAAILARVQAQEAEEQEAKEEWNPFADVEGSRAREVGFEEELDQDDDEDAGQRAYGGRRGYDASSSADEDEQPGQQSRRTSGRSTPAGPAAAAAASSASSATSVASERAAERLLILAYSQHGPALFARTNDATARRSPSRKALLADLERQTGRSWDDSLVESWAVMFERNPRKGALLMAAGGGGGAGGAMLLPNSNRGGAGEEEHTRGSGSGFGPDRGRGGRVLRGARGGGVGRGGGGGGAPPRGGGSGAGGGAGGHSGNDRSARRKEQRGNQQRTRGADRKARAMGGAGAGV